MDLLPTRSGKRCLTLILLVGFRIQNLWLLLRIVEDAETVQTERYLVYNFHSDTAPQA